MIYPYLLSHTHKYNTTGYLELPYIPIAEARGFTATRGNIVKTAPFGAVIGSNGAGDENRTHVASLEG